MNLISVLLRSSAASKRTAGNLSGTLSMALLAAMPAIFLPKPAIAAPSAAIAESASQASEIPFNWVAQADEERVLSFNTPTYAVRVFRQNRQLFMNVYNQTTGFLEQDARFATIDAQGEGQTTYVSFGDNFIRNNSRQSVGYRATINTQGNAELRIVSREGTTLLAEVGSNVIANEPPAQVSPAAAARDTILFFVTNTYSTRVFRQNDQLLMNVSNNRGGTELDARPATIAPPRNQNDAWTTYASARRDNNGALTTYLARISPTGVAEMEVIDSSGRTILREISERAEINNSPSQIVQGEERPYVVAIPRRNDGTLAEVREFYPEAYWDTSRQGRFVNAGSFADRNFAEARASVLRANGMDARVVFRSVTFFY